MNDHTAVSWNQLEETVGGGGERADSGGTFPAMWNRPIDSEGRALCLVNVASTIVGIGISSAI